MEGDDLCFRLCRPPHLRRQLRKANLVKYLRRLQKVGAGFLQAAQSPQDQAEVAQVNRHVVAAADGFVEGDGLLEERASFFIPTLAEGQAA